MRLLVLALVSIVSLVGCWKKAPPLPVTHKARQIERDMARQPAPDDRALVQSIRQGNPPGDADPGFVEAVRCVDEAHGRLEFDGAGRLVGVDLAGGRVSVTDEDVEALAALAHLRTLKLTGGGITNRSAKVIGTMAGLVELSLQESQIDDDGFARLAGLGKLTSLAMRRCGAMTDAGLAQLANFPALTHLALIEDNFTDEGMTHVAGLEKLRMLDLRGCAQVTDAGLARLKDLDHLKALKLAGYAINDDSMAVVKQLQDLRSLAVEDCGVTGAGLARIRDLPLEDLTISRCLSINDEALRCLEGFAKLKRLSLRDTPIGGGGLVHLADKKGLAGLNLSETFVGAEGLEHLRGLTGLERLELRRAPIGDAGLAIVGSLPNLRSLDLEDTGAERRRAGATGRAGQARNAPPQAQPRRDRCGRRAPEKAEGPEVAEHRPDGHLRRGCGEVAQGAARLPNRPLRRTVLLPAQDRPGCRV